MLIRKFNKKIITTTLGVVVMLFLQGQDSIPAAGSSNDTILVGRANSPRGVLISGTITDAASGKGVVGIRVQVEQYSASITDASGHFTLTVPSYTSTVIVEGEGYDTRRIPLKGRKTFTAALLDAEHESFNETVVLPFGRKNKSEVTASVGQYNVNSAWNHPTEMPDAVLQGRIAGLNVVRRSGTPGAGANMFLRGYNSLFATNKPLVIVDNMLFDANDYGESIIANSYANPMALINLQDVDNITVLKDASSMYGSKGANGAIIITTSKARTQATRIDFSAYTGFNLAPKNLPLMGAADYRGYLSEMLQSKGLSTADIQAQPYMTDDPQNPEYARYHYDTDWQRRVLGNSANQNYFLKVTGGDNIATYGLSMGFTKNAGVVKATDMTRYNTRFNADFNFTKRFTGSTNLSFSYNEQNLKDQGIANQSAPLFLALTKAPFMHFRELNAQGVESPNLAERDTLGITNPLAVIEGMQAYNKYYRFFGTFQFNYDISNSFRASSLIGVVYDKVRENFFVPRKGFAEDTLSNAIAGSRMGSQVKRLFSIYNDTRLEYNKTYSSIHKVASRLGVRYQRNNAEQDFGRSYNSATDDLIGVQNGLPALRQVGGGIGDWNWMNVYLSADYGFRDKLFLSFNAAVDGSSRFGKQAANGVSFGENKYAVMPSIGAAWLVSSENFMANTRLDLLKLRATYSVAGNDDIGNYSSRQTYRSQNLLGAQGLVRSGIANPALQWETVKKLNLGFDLAFWNERISLSLDAYQSKTENMLVYQPLLSISGFESVLTNGGRMQNTGLEASLNMRMINTVNFKWDAGINISAYKNKILSVPNGRFTTEYAGATILTANGLPASQFYGYVSDGVYGTDAEAQSAKTYLRDRTGALVPFKAGDVKFVNTANGVGDTLTGGTKVSVIDMNDRQVIGDANPLHTGGFHNRFIWKHFEMNALFTWSQGNDVYNYLRYRLESGSGVENQLQSVNNRWRGHGQVTNMPRATWGDPAGNSRFSDRWMEDGSYFRLRSLSLQYNIPMKSEGFLRSTTVYAIANNVFTLTEYKGYDPEFSVRPTVFSQGIDTGLDPQFRNITLGVRLGL